MMQLQKQDLNFAFKSDDDSSGAFSLSSRTTALLDGKAVDDILYTREASTPQRALAVTTSVFDGEC